MTFFTLLDLQMCEAKENPNIHLLIENKQMGTMPTWISLAFLICYVVNNYLYTSNLNTSAFTIMIIYKFYNIYKYYKLAHQKKLP